MATLVEKKVCQTCGAEVRPNALFCYGCGGSLAPEVIAAKDVKPDNKNIRTDNVIQFRERGGEVNNDNHSTANPAAAIEEPKEAPIPKPISESNLTAEPKLKSAAAMRRKSKNLQPKRVEIIWEEREDAPNAWFILAALVFALFAAGVLYVALQYK